MSDKKKTGPKPDTLKIEGDWEDAMTKAIKKKRRKDGWPKPGEKDSKPEDQDSDK